MGCSRSRWTGYTWKKVRWISLIWPRKAENDARMIRGPSSFFCNRKSKSLNVRDVAFLHLLESTAKTFVISATALIAACGGDKATTRKLQQSEEQFWRKVRAVCECLGKVTVAHADTYAIVICLNRVGITHGLATLILSFLLLA